MTRILWSGPVQELIDRAPNTLPGLWSLLATGCVAASALSRVPPLDDDLSLTVATHDLHEAMGELDPAMILVLDKGRVVARGTHAELLESSEIYADIYSSQLVDDSAERIRARQALPVAGVGR